MFTDCYWVLPALLSYYIIIIVIINNWFFRFNDMFKSFKEIICQPFLFVILTLIYIFTYIGSKYRLSVSLFDL